MTRAAIIEALQRHHGGQGPEVRVLAQGIMRPCRWHEVHGPQWLDFDDCWRNDALDEIECYAAFVPTGEYTNSRE